MVRVRDSYGVVHELVHGDLIGRVWSAALPINDGRVSEAHAMISLREGELRLLGLRGAFALHGRPTSDLALEAGQRVQLAQVQAQPVSSGLGDACPARHGHQV